MAAALFAGLVPAAEFDLVIRNARIADGSGQALFTGSIAVKDGRIAAVGEVSGTADRELDARDNIVAPGFIDVHTHSENILDLPQAENFLRMGVTTIITGNCGGSKIGVGKFFADLEATNTALNVATLIGHNTVRSQVMGGSFMRPPTGEELEKMKALVDQAMQDGAVGLSTGLIYLPGTFAKTEEIIELAKVASAHGGIYVSHMRHETVKIFDALDELLRIAREAKIRAEVSHIKLSGPNAWGKADEVLAYLDKARADGLEVTHDQYAYTASSTGLSQMIPDTAREGGNKRFIARIDDPEQKAKIVKEMKDTLRKSARTDFSYAVIAQYRKDKSLNGKNIAQAAKLKRGSDSLDDQIELILDLERHGGGSAVYHSMDEPDLKKFLQHPLTMVASDAGPRLFGDGVPHPRGYGNNARILGHYVRELKIIKVEEAIHKMTALPAQTFRLKNRGELKPGFVADLVVFDPEKVSDPATFDKPHAYAIGFTDVLVNGVPVIRDGALTPARPGKPVRLKDQ
jgi:N-acyl-D-amino-acid deacylase